MAVGIGQPPPWVYLKRQIFLRSDSFVESKQSKVPQGSVPLALHALWRPRHVRRTYREAMA